MTDWTPATDAEAAMRDALRAGDQELYFRILARVELLLPVSSEAIAGRAPMGWGTWTAGERTHVLAFTSSEAMQVCLAEHAGSARKIPYHELAAGWPNLEWWLAVDPGLPIEGYLPAWFISQLARGDVRLPGRSAQRQPQPERAESLARARVAVPAQSRPGVLLADEPAADSGTVAGPTAEPGAGATAEPGAGGTAEPGAGATAEPGAGPVAEPAGRSTDFEPANELEARLLASAAPRSTDSFLSVLLLAKVLLPAAKGADPAVRPGGREFVWCTEETEGGRQVVAFTSAERFAEHTDEPGELVGVRFVQLIRSWPDESWSLAVNPGTPVGATLPGSQIAALASTAAEVGLGDDAGEAGEYGRAAAHRAGDGTGSRPPITTLQKVVAPHQVGWYLDRGYDRVSGFVHRISEVDHLRTPAGLVRALGLRYDGSPFALNAAEVHVLRWPAYRPSLYRIPYGGRTEAAMAAMQGWVIERAPFRGNGFAPAEGDDVIAEFKVDSIRLPHGAELWRIDADGSSQLVARLDADSQSWARVEP